VFPGQQHELNVTAGDLSQWYNMSCAAGIGGQVQLTVTGPVVYQGVVPGALMPVMAGNVFTYTVADFGAIDNESAFKLIFLTDTSAQAGDDICIHVLVTPGTGDNNAVNNSIFYCYEVVNSMDPNNKEVYPSMVSPSYSDYLTYTIHFQNVGTASAANIRIMDTLNSSLDLTTFQLIKYSHANNVTLIGNVLTVRFPGINLPDSLNDPDGSTGFLQYRIKPKQNLPAGTQIENTAWIYFDYNAPIVTNTSVSYTHLTLPTN
jgi:uncharacterized repeat protein (TIGR01451 family)